MLHYLRIAATALCLTACVLLIALWVRSQRTADSVQWHSDGGISASSFDGQIELMFDSGKTDYPNMEEGFTYQTFPNLVWAWPGPSTYGFSMATGSPGVRFVQIPHWFPILLLGLTAIAPWIKWRFRLRTLLIATTLVAVALGAIVLSH